MYIGHKRDDGTEQALKAHLEEVAQLAGTFARVFQADAAAERSGMLHDIGKYSPAGQRRMRNPERTPKVDHSTAGAKEAYILRDAPACFAIASHHGGLTDKGDLKIRIEKDLTGELDYSEYKSEVSVARDASAPDWLSANDAFALQHYTRMLFSCLVDADYLNTEAFIKRESVAREGGDPPTRLLELLNKYIAENFEGKPGKKLTAINEKRAQILDQCILRAASEPGLFTFTVPTGGGKTISSLAFALNHAVSHNKRRVIYVIPYTSIIDQNAGVFAEILGDENVLAHHSNVDYADDTQDAEDSSARRKRLATENWYAPVIVTTAVQFFESLFAARTSRCRKLHNIAQSVVIFDEAQMLPLSYLRPCVAEIVELVKHYGVTAVLCTATQPALKNLLREFAPGLHSDEICGDTAAMYEFFRRVRYQARGDMSTDEVSFSISQEAQALCVVNSRKLAKDLFELLPNKDSFHLSTRMTPMHRKTVINQIRDRLLNNKPCRVVSTSLIEAGVDVDFPTVWREEAGLDSIIQAAGRCNREGKRDRNESIVNIFRIEGAINKNFAPQIDSARAALRLRSDMDAPETIRAYFKALIELRGKEALDAKEILKLCEQLRFASIEERFKIIDDDMVSVYIPTDTNGELLDALRNGTYTRSIMRKLGLDSVGVRVHEARALMNAGKAEITRDGHYILADKELYNENTGLSAQFLAGGFAMM